MEQANVRSRTITVNCCLLVDRKTSCFDPVIPWMAQMINVNLSTKLLLMKCDFVNSFLIFLGIIQRSITTDLNLNSTFSTSISPSSLSTHHKCFCGTSHQLVTTDSGTATNCD